MARTSDRLNLGCGGQRPAGWVNLDRIEPADVVHDLYDPLPFADGEFVIAVAHHVLDLFTLPDLLRILAECRRVARRLRFSFADPRLMAEAARLGDAAFFHALDARGGTFADQLRWQLDLGGARLQALTPELATIVVHAAGFDNVALSSYRMGEGSELDSRPTETTFMEAW